MEFLNKFKHGHDSGGKQEEHQPPLLNDNNTNNTNNTAPVDPAAAAAAAATYPTEPEPERDLLSKLIAGSGHHHQPHAHPDAARKCREQRSRELVQREAELRYKLDLLDRDRADKEDFFATLRARFDHEAEHDKLEAHAAGTPGAFWDRFTGKEEMERSVAELERRAAELRVELQVVEREKRENAHEKAHGDENDCQVGI